MSAGKIRIVDGVTFTLIEEDAPRTKATWHSGRGQRKGNWDGGVLGGVIEAYKGGKWHILNQTRGALFDSFEEAAMTSVLNRRRRYEEAKQRVEAYEAGLAAREGELL